jgi:hypothetical protein
MKYCFKSAITLLAIVSTTITSCTNPIGVWICNESERDIFLSYQLKGAQPDYGYCAKGESDWIHLTYALVSTKNL